MKISDYKGEDALDLLADILEPTIEICSDKKLAMAMEKKESMALIIKQILKDHKKSILTILAYIDGEDPATYSPSIFVLPGRLLELFQDEEFMQLFHSQGQKISDLSSGPVTESTTEKEK